MKEIGQYFKERFDQFEPNPPSDFWAKIQNDKSLKRFNKMQSFKRFFKFGFTPAAVVVIAIVLWVSNTQKESTQNQAAVNTLQPTTIVTKQVSNSVPQQEQTLKTDIVPQESTPTKKNNDKLAVNKVEPTTELTKSNVEPIQSQNLIKSNPISNKVSPSSTNNSVPVNNTPKESPKTNTKGSSNNQSEANPSLNKTSIEEEPVLENSIDNTNNNEPEEGIDKLMMPNSFTPNGDGINDQFLVKAMWSVQEFEIIIYERSGNVVFKTNDIGMGWDGTHLGKEIHSGVYVYLVTYKDSMGNKQKTKGTLNLIR